MRIAVAADELTGVAQALPEELRRRGHEPLLHGAYSDAERPDSLRTTSDAELVEILDALFGGIASADRDDVENIAHLSEIERSS
jgi:hypothetical protein